MVYMYSQSALDVLINSPTTMFAVPLFFQMKIVVMLEKNKPNQQAVIKEICSSIDHYFCTDLYYRHWHTAVIISVQLCFVSITTVWFSFSKDNTALGDETIVTISPGFTKTSCTNIIC